MLSQTQIRDWVFPTVLAASAAGRPNEVAFVQETGKLYSYVTAALTPDGISILDTPDLGNSFWVAITSANSPITGYQPFTAYAAGTIVEYRGYLAVANGSIPVSAIGLDWGTTGATWKPIVDSSKVWRGLFNSATAYAVDDVVAAADNNLFISNAVIGSPGVGYNPINGANRDVWTPWFSNKPESFIGASSAMPGRQGITPAPAAGQELSYLRGNGVWDNTLGVMPLSLGDLVSSPSVATIDQYDVFLLTQNTLYSATLPNPSNTQAIRKVTFFNAQSSSVSAQVNNVVIAAGSFAEFLWNGTAWVPHTSEINWEFTTNGINVAAGHSYVIDGAHTINLPTATNGSSIRFATKVDWSSLGATWVAPGATTVGAGQTIPGGYDVAELIYSSTSNNWVITMGGNLPVSDTIQSLNATGAVSAWSSVVLIGSVPLAANAVLTLPSAAGASGKHIKFIRVDGTSFTVTLATSSGNVLTTISAGSELNVQNGSITVEATSSTEIKQVASVLSGGAVMTGATITVAGTQGSAPAPQAGSHLSFLRGDALWVQPSQVYEVVVKAAHGFTAPTAVYHNGTTWVKTDGSNPAAVAQGVVTLIVDANTFVVTTHGKATVTGHGKTVGEYYWLSGSTLGADTSVQPTSGIVQSLFHVRDANTLFINVGTALSL